MAGSNLTIPYPDFRCRCMILFQMESGTPKSMTITFSTVATPQQQQANNTQAQMEQRLLRDDEIYDAFNGGVSPIDISPNPVLVADGDLLNEAVVNDTTKELLNESNFWTAMNGGVDATKTENTNFYFG